MIKIIRGTDRDTIDIFVTQDNEKGIPVEFLTIGKDGQIVYNKYIEYKPVKPLWSFTGRQERSGLLSEILDAFIEYGIKPKHKTLDEREKFAMEKHLEDMRTITFYKLGIKK